MTGVLAIWNDCAPSGEAHYEHWYNREHLLERIAVPGFRSGRRYEALRGDRRFFTFYEVDGLEVLTSPAYLDRLANPTAGTLQAMASFQSMTRTVCEVAASAGALIGAYALTWRIEGSMQPTPDVGALVADLAARDGVARVQLWAAAASQTPEDTVEMRSRGGGDRTIGGALVVEYLRRRDAERLTETFALEGVPSALGASGPSPLGLYALLCIHAGPAP